MTKPIYMRTIESGTNLGIRSLWSKTGWKTFKEIRDWAKDKSNDCTIVLDKKGTLVLSCLKKSEVYIYTK